MLLKYLKMQKIIPVIFPGYFESYYSKFQLIGCDCFAIEQKDLEHLDSGDKGRIRHCPRRHSFLAPLQSVAVKFSKILSYLKEFVGLRGSANFFSHII